MPAGRLTAISRVSTLSLVLASTGCHGVDPARVGDSGTVTGVASATPRPDASGPSTTKETTGRVDCPLNEPWPVPYRYEGSAHVKIHGAEYDVDLPNQRAFCGALSYRGWGALKPGEGSIFVTCAPNAFLRVRSEAASTDETRLAATSAIELDRTTGDPFRRHLGTSINARPTITIGPGRRTAKVAALLSESPNRVDANGALTPVPNLSKVLVEIEFDCSR